MYKLLILLTACCMDLYTCQDLTEQKVGYFNRLNHAVKLTDNALKYSSKQNKVLPVSRLVITKDDVINRAEEVLSSGLLDNPLFEVSSLCLNNTKLFIEALIRNEDWAVRMFDSMGKPGSDLLDGNIRWIGNWEECRGVVATEYYDNYTTVLHPYKGKYCTGYIPIQPPQQVYIQIGMCFPDTCSEADTSALLRTLQSLLSQGKPFNPGGCLCKENSLEYSDKAITVIVICGVFGTIILLATLYDVIVEHFLSKRSKGYAPLMNGNDYGSTGHRKVNGNVRNGHNIKETSVHGDIIGKESRSYRQEPVYSYYTPGIFGRLLLSFSVYTNAAKILNTNQPAATLTSVNGIRFISMTWVILGHSYFFGLSQVENAATYLPQLYKRFTFQAISNATVAVDTFFVLSGLLVSYLSLREMERRGGARKFNWIMFYFHRFWRLTPPYMLFIMLYVPTFKYWADGPFWPQQGVEDNECNETWWTNLLYVNNFVKTDKMCMGWSWYLANDMQFYVISPIMLIPLYYSPLLGSMSCMLLALVGFISAGVISKTNHFEMGVENNDNFDKLYIKPYTRVAPYVVGFFTGFLLYKTNCKVKMPKVINMFGWAVATTFAMLALYGLYTPDGGTKHLNEDVTAFYNASFRTAWGMAVAWVIFACATGYGGPVNALLSWKGIIPLSRLTYCAYLVHPIAMDLYYKSRKTLMNWYDLEIIYLFLGNLCISYAAAFIISLAFESPMMGLEKVLLKRNKNS
ncbi:nose resistant to fluoxetine protein 6-like isoform X2 [Mercenaria mercenaria]|uniref:nose resistant to fluoxetine protein 6-like isoform X2 n=1 Tax=Mercenaria mercenaria TaxID=6596 RepID=UPI00234E5946|nr:nose resistant to fluoxetine protein 6-like isoform X2 [Mercenaria mercenaria]